MVSLLVSTVRGDGATLPREIFRFLVVDRSTPPSDSLEFRANTLLARLCNYRLSAVVNIGLAPTCLATSSYPKFPTIDYRSPTIFLADLDVMFAFPLIVRTIDNSLRVIPQRFDGSKSERCRISFAI